MDRQYFYLRFKKSRSKASVLIVCLWTIMILSILGMGLTGLAFQEIRFAKSYRSLVTSMSTARAAMKAVFYLRGSDPTPDFDTLDELTFENRHALCSDNAFKYYFTDQKKLDDGTVEIIDESGLINLNTATSDVLRRLPGMNDDLADKIVQGTFRPFGSVNEVLMVEGMTKDDFMLFKAHVTVHGQGKVNINTASRQVLSALGLDNDLIEAILRFRKEHKIISTDPKSEGSFLGYGFSNIGTILDELRDFTTLFLKDEQDILSLLSVFVVKSEYLRFNVIHVFGEKEGQHYSIVVHPESKKVLSWAEY